MTQYAKVIRMITAEEYKKPRAKVLIIYLATVDGKKIQDGYAIAEVLRFNDKGAVMKTCYRQKNKYYQCEANVMNAGRYIHECDAFAFTHGNEASTVTEPVRSVPFDNHK